jgi:ABC-2 type transport system ATP-binding protein
MNAVELQDVTKRFGDHVAVDCLDLAVPEGAIYGFIGPNGSGKTTTLRMILRIFYPESGRISVLGREQSRVADDRVGYLPEERGLYKRMKVRDLLTYYARLKGFRRCRREIDDWLARFDLGKWASRRIDTLSKGMAQKVQFISAVVARPRLLVLDEPFTGLDPLNMEAIKDAIVALHRGGTTVIFSTHDMDIAERMCDTVFMICRGRKVLDGTLESIQDQYGQDTIRVRVAEKGDRYNLPERPDHPSVGARCSAQIVPVPFFDGLPGVIRVNEYGRYTELRMAPQADPQAILRELLGRAKIEHFELARPSLHDIFIRVAGAEARPAEEADRG